MSQESQTPSSFLASLRSKPKASTLTVEQREDLMNLNSKDLSGGQYVGETTERAIGVDFGRK